MLLRQIAQNLIINALKYSTGPKVVVGLKHEGPDAWLTVQDAGPGIDLADQERIFNEFERLSRTGVPGSGLGLSIVQRACQQLGHEVALASAPGRGSRFRVRLPVMRNVCLMPEETAEPGGRPPSGLRRAAGAGGRERPGDARGLRDAAAQLGDGGVRRARAGGRAARPRAPGRCPTWS